MTELSLLTFTMAGECFRNTLDIETIAKIALENDIRQLDMIGFEIDILGENAVRQALRYSGMRMGCCIAEAPFYDAPEKVEKMLCDALARAERLGAEMLMVIPGNGSSADKAACAAMTRQELLERAAACYGLAVELGNRRGIRICFENTPHAWKPLSAAEDCLYVLQRVPGLGFVFDTANFRVEDTSCSEADAYALLKDYVVRVHLKDVVIDDSPVGEKCCDGKYMRAVPTGTGCIPIGELIRTFVRDGFSGTCAVEYNAPADVHGLGHASALAPYCRYIHEAGIC